MPVLLEDAGEKSPNQARVLTLNDQKLQMYTRYLQEFYYVYLINLMSCSLILYHNISLLNLRKIIRC